MNILVTGGAGFLGSNLCKTLLQQGNFVVCIDNLYTGKKSNIYELKNNDNFIFSKCDIVYNKKKIENIIKKYKIQQIYNLACPASPPAYQDKHSIETTKTCVVGCLNMLELASKYNIRILQTSTSEIYGEPLEHPQSENYRGNVNCTGIRACYDEGKRCAESLFFDFFRNYNTDIRIVRIFNTYGPYMDKNDGRVVSNFINQALRGQNITIYGDGKQTRSFCYVDDTIKGLIKTMNFPDCSISPVNIGNPVEYTIDDLARLIRCKINPRIDIIYKPLPKDDPTRRKPCIDKAVKLLNWKPEIELSKGLEKTINYFKNIKE